MAMQIFLAVNFDGLVEYAQRYGAKGLAWIQYTETEIKSPFKKFYSEETFQKIKEATNAQTGDLLLVVADKPLVVAQALGELRLEMGRRRGLINENEYKFLWVVDFPMFEYDEENKRWKAMHHPSQHHVMKMYNISQLTQVA